MITNAQTRTNVHEIVEGICRVNTPVELPDGATGNTPMHKRAGQRCGSGQRNGSEATLLAWV